MTWVAHGREEILVANVGGTLFAMDNICPHSGGSLADGYLEGTLVTCPFHMWEFDVATGCCTHIKNECLRQFPVMVVDGRIFVELPSAE